MTIIAWIIRVGLKRNNQNYYMGMLDQRKGDYITSLMAGSKSFKAYGLGRNRKPL